MGVSMRNLATMVAATALLVPFFAPPVFGHEKPLPPAFGKELVPDEMTKERKEPEAAELEELQDQRKSAGTTGGVRPAQRGGKLHIRLEGDEDGEDGDDDF
jgi:hypothetical protein